MDYVLKTARNEENEIVWQAVYHAGIKQFESPVLDVDAIKRTLGVEELHGIDIIEPNPYHYEAAFPPSEDFSYLLDYTPIHVGKAVYLETGKHVVASLETVYRNAGHYPVVDWFYRGDKLRSRTLKTFYVGHAATRFTVEGSNDTYVWEDYNYQQSFLHEFLG